MKKKIELIKKLIPVDFVRRLKDENVYLKTEIKEEKEKLENTIKTLNKELEEVKEDNRKLVNEIDHHEQLREKMHYTI
tara:strand:+ start:234 stop:467 length:234 start_codon:yes stop_codon:yes gene_type:complete